MGYRSDVTAVFYARKQEDFPLIKLWLQENFPMEAFADEVKWLKRGLLVEITQYKWYPDYTEVKQFNKAVEIFVDLFCKSERDKDSVGCYEFIRVGEDYTDIENDHAGDIDWILDVNRTIDVRED